MIVIKTHRLILRQFRIRDAAFVLTLLNTPGWLRFIGDRGIHNITDARKYILDRVQSSYTAFGFGMYIVELRDAKISIGMCGLLKRDTLEDVDIGFAFLPEYNGYGYAHEAAAATISYANDNLNLKRVIAITDNDNESSKKLLGKLGMKYVHMVRLAEDDVELMLFST